MYVILVAVMLTSCKPVAIVISPTETLIPSTTITPIPPTATPEPTSVLPMPIEPGTYLVGTDVAPGIYRGQSEGELPKGICGWNKLKDLSGKVDAIVAGNTAHGQFYVEIKDSDYAFQTTCKLVPIDSLPDNTGYFPAKIEYGMYLVGRDIQAGTYKGIPQHGANPPCFWERLRHVAGSYTGVIANHHETKDFYVEVLETDFALFTTCQLERVKE